WRRLSQLLARPRRASKPPRRRARRTISSLALLGAAIDQLSADGVVLEPHLARGLRHRIVGEADVERPRIDVQADRALVERIRDAMDAVVALLQIEHAQTGPLDSAVRHQPDAVAGAGAIEGEVVVESQRAALDREPAELAG